MNEVKTRYKHDNNTTTFYFKNVPLDVTLTPAYGGTIMTFNLENTYCTYDGDLQDKNFEKYKKEISALFQDFDDIFAEVNKKYGLKSEN